MFYLLKNNFFKEDKLPIIICIYHSMYFLSFQCHVTYKCNENAFYIFTQVPDNRAQ